MPPPFPPLVAKNNNQTHQLHDLVREQGVEGFDGIVQTERALSRLAHGHGVGAESLDEIYAREGAFHKPYLPEEAIPEGSVQGMGSRTQADVTPGAEPTKKPEGGA